MWTVVSKVILHKESTEDPGEEDARLALVVGNVPGVLDELRHVDIRDVESSNFGNKLISHGC